MYVCVHVCINSCRHACMYARRHARIYIYFFIKKKTGVESDHPSDDQRLSSNRAHMFIYSNKWTTTINVYAYEWACRRWVWWEALRSRTQPPCSAIVRHEILQYVKVRRTLQITHILTHPEAGSTSASHTPDHTHILTHARSHIYSPIRRQDQDKEDQRHGLKDSSREEHWGPWFWRLHPLLGRFGGILLLLLLWFGSCIRTVCGDIGGDMSCGQMRRTATRTATRCNTLRRTATIMRKMRHTATHCSALQCTAAQCGALQHTATRCNTLQHTATHCNTLMSKKTCHENKWVMSRVYLTFVVTNELSCVLQLVAVCCSVYSVLQCVAVCCSVSNELWSTYQWVVSHVYIGKQLRLIIQMDEACQVYERGMSRMWMLHIVSCIWMRHVTLMNVIYHMNVTRHVTYMNEACHTYEFDTSCHVYECGMSHAYECDTSHVCEERGIWRVWMRHVTHLREVCHTYECVVSIDEACHTCDCDKSRACEERGIWRVWMRHVTHLNEVCRTYECVVSINEACHAYYWGMSHI